MINLLPSNLHNYYSFLGPWGVDRRRGSEVRRWRVSETVDRFGNVSETCRPCWTCSGVGPSSIKWIDRSEKLNCSSICTVQVIRTASHEAGRMEVIAPDPWSLCKLPVFLSLSS